jgi:hypothetical protein
MLYQLKLVECITPSLFIPKNNLLKSVTIGSYILLIVGYRRTFRRLLLA